MAEKLDKEALVSARAQTVLRREERESERIQRRDLIAIAIAAFREAHPRGSHRDADAHCMAHAQILMFADMNDWGLDQMKSLIEALADRSSRELG